MSAPDPFALGGYSTTDLGESDDKATPTLEELALVHFEPEEGLMWPDHLVPLNKKIDNIAVNLRVALSFLTMTKPELVRVAMNLWREKTSAGKWMGQDIDDGLQQAGTGIKQLEEILHSARVRYHIACAVVEQEAEEEIEQRDDTRAVYRKVGTEGGAP
jgi:hypothetical protein